MIYRVTVHFMLERADEYLTKLTMKRVMMPYRYPASGGFGCDFRLTAG